LYICIQIQLYKDNKLQSIPTDYRMRRPSSPATATDLHRASVARTSVFRRCTWHHCATVAAAQRPFLFLRVGNRLAHTCVACYYNSRGVTFPGYRVACSAVGATPVFSRHPSVRRAATSPLLASSVNSSLLLFWHFSTYQIPACYQFSTRPLAIDTRQQYSGPKVQVPPTSTDNDNIGNIILQSYITHLRPNIDFQLAGKPT